ncbi:MAG: hypothetical protein NTV51_28635 [Verrucomicrobia bacterium]|nr:hypothetical protein [Verrucomicrobiota bacterium]
MSRLPSTRLRFLVLAALLLVALPAARASEEWFDRLDEALTASALEGAFRTRVSGTVDLEGYHLPTPAPALISASRTDLFNPRLTLFLDAQLGRQLYAFVQARADHGFDPGDGPLRRRVDEFALRFIPWKDGRFNLQLGKFATVVGNWVNRHGTWENPFINAPLPYENLTGIWDTEAVASATTLLQWSHVRPGLSAPILANEKRLRIPVIWGPSYATGLAVSGALGAFRYAAELKNSPLSSRPTSWTKAQKWWTYPAVAARLGYAPNALWNFGVSASTGTYLRPSATRTIAPGFGRGDYRQLTFGQDVSFAWHHWQLWAELYETRFEIPRVGDAHTVAGYLEAKYKFTAQFFGAVRWNRQLFGTIPDGVRGPVHWGADVWRVDLAPGYRLTPHIQLKAQYSLQQEAAIASLRTHTLSSQLTVRF